MKMAFTHQRQALLNALTVIFTKAWKTVSPAIFTAVFTAVFTVGAQAQEAVPPDPASESDRQVSIPPDPLPKNLKGRWHNKSSGHSDLVEIEILEMTSPRDGKAEVTFWPYCRKSETPVVFERKLRVWRFTAMNCSGNAEQIHMRVRPVEGKNRMEGWYHREGDGRTVYLEW